MGWWENGLELVGWMMGCKIMMGWWVGERGGVDNGGWEGCEKMVSFVILVVELVVSGRE